MWCFRLLPGFALCAFAATPGLAQTKPDAAASNIQLATTLCIQKSVDMPALRAVFATSGHLHSTENDGGGNILHSYGTPDGSVSTTLVDDQAGLGCRISTDQFGVSQMIPLSRAVLDQLSDGSIWAGSPEGVKITPGVPQAANNVCSGFHILPGRTVVWFTFGIIGQDPVCIDDGTAQIMISL